MPLFVSGAALSGVDLAPLGVTLAQAVQSFPEGSVLTRRCLDDILISSVVKKALRKIKDVIVQAAPELTFSSEEPD